jgi:hypothetical protein
MRGLIFANVERSRVKGVGGEHFFSILLKKSRLGVDLYKLLEMLLPKQTDEQNLLVLSILERAAYIN